MQAAAENKRPTRYGRRMRRSRTRTVMALRRAEVARLYNLLRGQGETNIQATIAQQLGVDPATVSRDLDYLDIEWRKTQIDEYHAERMRQLARLDYLLNEARAGWERSKLQEVELTTQSEEVYPAAGTPPIATTTQPRHMKVRRKVITLTRRADSDPAPRVGDPRFLHEMLGILAARRQIYWSSHAPVDEEPASKLGDLVRSVARVCAQNMRDIVPRTDDLPPWMPSSPTHEGNGDGDHAPALLGALVPEVPSNPT
jgi:hypothetical protein